jgi:nucleolar pre-ribosomal-associated protein 1
MGGRHSFYSTIVAVAGATPSLPLLEDMIAMSLTSQIPLCHDGVPPTSLLCITIPALCLPRSGYLTSIPPNLSSQFLHRETWSDSIAKIVATLLYIQGSSSSAFATWLNNLKWWLHSIDHVAMILSAFLDLSQSNVDELIQLNKNVLENILEQLFSDWPSYGNNRLLCLQCICHILQLGAA